MTVLDASVFANALISVGSSGERARDELKRLAVLEVPAIFAAEVTSALRAVVLRGQLSAGGAAVARRRLQTTRTIQYPFEPFAARAWELRDNLTIYDAWYVALAEWLGTDLLTADERLAHASGPRCNLRLISELWTPGWV